MGQAQQLAALHGQVRDRFREHLKRAIDDALRASEDVLWDWAYNSMRNRTLDCLDLMRMVKAKRDEFSEALLRQYDEGLASSASRDDDDAPIELQLVDDEVVDLQAAMDEFANALQGYSEAWRTGLKSQLVRLDESGVQPPLSVHIAASSLSEALRSGATEMGLEPQQQIIFFKLFARCAVPTLARGYSVVSDELVQAGIRPDAPKVVVDDGGMRGLQAQHIRTTTHRDAAGNTTTTTERYAFAGMHAQHMAQALYSYGAGAPVTPPAGAMPVMELPAGGASMAPPQLSSVPPALQQFAARQTPLVGSVLSDYSEHVPASVMQQLMLVLARIGAAQPELFRDAQHPVRTLLDQAVLHSGDGEEREEIVRSLPETLGAIAAGLEAPSDWEKQSAALPEQHDVDESVAIARRRRAREEIAAARQWAQAHVDRAVSGAQLVEHAQKWFRAVFVPYLAWIRVRRALEATWLDRADASLDALLPLLTPATARSAEANADTVLLRLLDDLREAGAGKRDLRRISLRFRALHKEALRAADQAAEAPDASATPSVGAPVVAEVVPLESATASSDAEADTVESAAVSSPAPDTGVAADAPAERVVDTPAEAQTLDDRAEDGTLPDALAQARQRASERERRERFLDFVRDYFADPELWWRVEQQGRTHYAQLVEIPARKGQFRFQPMFGQEAIQLDVEEMMQSLTARRSRPLRASAEVLQRLDALTA